MLSNRSVSGTDCVWNCSNKETQFNFVFFSVDQWVCSFLQSDDICSLSDRFIDNTTNANNVRHLSNTNGSLYECVLTCGNTTHFNYSHPLLSKFLCN